ncbi:alpha/beta hydrolase [Streptomyces sp. SDr-06]|uniref:alpha/beta fold hydrolase n=1 Tax=Streptomyces sp. SDr-06 TaxID=2267702 RepID=UPI000DEA4571|nr:alpha/beta hydrolase [Streptomyces sp. SDr-06]RCH70025.1 alpha/beta hydrolase [Streptomyces sp. SDr-06]
MPYFTTATDGTTLHFIDYGPADGPTLVFVNSAYFSTQMWEFQMLPLAEEGFRCVGFDRRGHGRSQDVWGGFDLDTLADDLGSFLDHLDLRDVTLIGHSLGTAEAVRYLTRHGSERVARLVLVGAMAPGIVHSEDNPAGLPAEAIKAANETFRKDRAEFFSSGAADYFALGHPGNNLSAAYVQKVVQDCHGATPRAATAAVANFETLEMAPEARKIDVPTLVIHGDQDASAPIDLTGRRCAELIPDNMFKLYENGGHGLYVTHAEQLNADLREFASR